MARTSFFMVELTSYPQLGAVGTLGKVADRRRNPPRPVARNLAPATGSSERIFWRIVRPPRGYKQSHKWPARKRANLSREQPRDPLRDSMEGRGLQPHRKQTA